MSGERRPMLLPADHRPGAGDAAFTRPWFAHERSGDRPAIFTFVGTDESFVDAFFRGITTSKKDFAPGAFPKLLPARDFAEPPKALFDAAGEPVYTRAHAEPLPAERTSKDELELDGKASFEEALIEAGVGDTAPHVQDIVFPDPTDPTKAAWLRKLYLPMHTHFHVVACELFCKRPHAPRIDPKRVLEAGLLVRRLIPDTKAKKPRWQDWLASPLGGGTWVEIADEEMKTLNGTTRVLDPALLPSDVLGAQDLAVRLHMGIAAKAPLALSTGPLAALPVTLGEAKTHTCRFGYLPLPAADKERPQEDPKDDEATLRGVFAAQAEEYLNERFVAKAAVVDQQIHDALLPLLKEFRDRLPFSFFQLDKITVVAPAKAIVAAMPGVIGAEIDATARLLGLAALAHFVNAELIQDPPLTVTARWDAAVARIADLFTPPNQIYEFPPTAFGDPPSSWARTALTLVRPAMSILMRSAVRDVIELALPASGDLGGTVELALRASMLLWVWRERYILLDAFYSGAFPDNKLPDFQKPKIDLADGALLRVRPTVTALGEELDAWIAVNEARATTPLPWPAPSSLPADSLQAHRLARALEAVMANINAQGAGAGGGWAEEMRERTMIAEGKINASLGYPRLDIRALQITAELERGLLVFPGISIDQTDAQSLVNGVKVRYTTTLPAEEIRTQGKAFRQVVRPRFDADSLYAVFCYARVAGRGHCETPEVIWSPRSEVFFLAEPMDLLGLKPVSVRMPDLPKLLRDIPRMKRARALPFAAMTTPQSSAITAGDDPKNTARDWGIAWICSFAIPVFTICAWAMFSVIFTILLAIPGFAWMLLLKICIPVPAPKKT